MCAQVDLGELADYDGPHHPKHSKLAEPENYSQIESGMIWLGVAGLQDPPRGEVRGAIERCAQAGIRVSHTLFFGFWRDEGHHQAASKSNCESDVLHCLAVTLSSEHSHCFFSTFSCG